MSGFFEKIFDFLAGRQGYRPTYVSDSTRFIQDYLKKHPDEIESQRAGRAIWWDKTDKDRAPTPSMRHAPRAGGNEATFQPAGGNEATFAADDNAPLKGS